MKHFYYVSLEEHEAGCSDLHEELIFFSSVVPWLYKPHTHAVEPLKMRSLPRDAAISWRQSTEASVLSLSPLTLTTNMPFV